MKRLMVALAAAVLLFSAAPASAAYVKNYRVRDAGERIVHRINWCVQKRDVRHGYETFVRWLTRVEHDDGSDVQIDRWTGWYSRGCWVTRLSYADQLRWRGWYWGRARISIKGQVIYTRWREFYSR